MILRLPTTDTRKWDASDFENKEMGIYFISDPDGYWLEIVPAKDRSLKISASADES